MSAQELLAEIRKLPPEEQRRLRDALASEADGQEPRSQQPISEDEVEQILLAKGIISEIPKRVIDDEEESYEPIEVPGKPLSETIIEERR